MGIIGLQKNPKVRIGSKSTVEDLSFPLLIPRMNNCTSVLHNKMLSHSSTTKWPWHRLWVNILQQAFLHPKATFELLQCFRVNNNASFINSRFFHETLSVKYLHFFLFVPRVCVCDPYKIISPQQIQVFNEINHWSYTSNDMEVKDENELMPFFILSFFLSFFRNECH